MSLIERVLEKASKAPNQGRVDLVDQSELNVLPESTGHIGERAGDSDIAAASKHAQSQQVTLDLNALRQRGMIVPGMGYTRIAEEYRRIKRLLMQRLTSGSAEAGSVALPNVVVVTSSVPAEGKTFSAVNLAMSLAMELDRTALLIDGDPANSGTTGLLGLADHAGFIDLLTNDTLDVSEVLLRTNVPKFAFIPSGRKTASVAELYASQAMASLLGEMSVRYADRVIILDGPPLIPTAEAAVLANLAGQIVFVVEAEKTPKHVVAEALRVLDGSRLAGIILNKTNQQNSADAYYGNYGSTYAG